MKNEDAFDRYRRALSTLTADTLDTLDALVSPDVRFKDPLHEVTGVNNMKRVFASLFKAADNIVFVVDDHACSSRTAYFRWTLTAQLSGKPWSVTGVTELVFDERGLVTDHSEFWDAASQLYERFPVIGGVLRFLRRRLAAH